MGRRGDISMSKQTGNGLNIDIGLYGTRGKRMTQGMQLDLRKLRKRPHIDEIITEVVRIRHPVG